MSWLAQWSQAATRKEGQREREIHVNNMRWQYSITLAYLPTYHSSTLLCVNLPNITSAQTQTCNNAESTFTQTSVTSSVSNHATESACLLKPQDYWTLLSHTAQTPHESQGQLDKHILYLVSCSHWWKALACCANSWRSLSFSSCLLCSFCSSSSRSYTHLRRMQQLNWTEGTQIYTTPPLHIFACVQRCEAMMVQT